MKVNRYIVKNVLTELNIEAGEFIFEDFDSDLIIGFVKAYDPLTKGIDICLFKSIQKSEIEDFGDKSNVMFCESDFDVQKAFHDLLLSSKVVRNKWLGYLGDLGDLKID